MSVLECEDQLSGDDAFILLPSIIGDPDRHMSVGNSIQHSRAYLPVHEHWIGREVTEWFGLSVDIPHKPDQCYRGQ